MKELPRIEFGNPILRQLSRQLTAQEVASEKIQRLIKRMTFTLANKKRGVGLAAPQVGYNIALAVINIQPTKHRPKAKTFKEVIINPSISEYFGRKVQMWEGCLSCGPSPLFAKVPRYKKIKAKYIDAQGEHHHKIFEGLPAQVLQHEVDHLNGVLFVDKVKDTHTYMTLKEYKKRVVRKATKL